MDPDAIDRVVRKFATEIGLDRDYSAHSMRATFVTTALENGAQLEDVQKAAGHRDPARPNSMIGEATIRRRRRRFLQRTESKMPTHEENHRVLCVAERYPRAI